MSEVDELRHILGLCHCNILNSPDCWFSRNNVEDDSELDKLQLAAITALIKVKQQEARITEIKWVFDNVPYDNMPLWEARIRKHVAELEASLKGESDAAN